MNQPAVSLDPIALGPNYATHSPAYVGGGGIARFRGLPATDPVRPEDWVGSATARFGQRENGLTRLPDGRWLTDAIAADPDGWLGPEHRARYGLSAGLLVKLLDSANRIGVHLHPSDEFAVKHLDCPFGKTEAWIILDTGGPDGDVAGQAWAGFTRDVSRDELAEWRRTNDVAAMLANLNQIPVRPGSAVLVPAGVPHGMGAHVLCLELQQPTDFSIGLEGRIVPGQDQVLASDLGLGAELALAAVDREAWPPARLAGLFGPGLSAPGPVLPAAADPFFRTELVSAAAGPVRLEEGFSIVVGVRGHGQLRGGVGDTRLPLSRGSTCLVPFGTGRVELTGDVEAIVCRPGNPAATRPSRPMA
jgi:mannose-6-phosphate isomerase